jgi:hypothetical protein
MPWTPDTAEAKWPRAHTLVAENAKLRTKLEQRGAVVAKLLEQITDLQSILRDARPIVFNALTHPNVQPWQKEIRAHVLARIDAAKGPDDGQAD